MQHAKYQGSMPGTLRQEDVMFYFLYAYVKHVTSRTGPFLALGA